MSRLTFALNMNKMQNNPCKGKRSMLDPIDLILITCYHKNGNMLLSTARPWQGPSGIVWGLGGYKRQRAHIIHSFVSCTKELDVGKWARHFNSTCCSLLVVQNKSALLGHKIHKAQPSMLHFLGSDWLFAHDAAINDVDMFIPRHSLPSRDGTRGPRILRFFRDRALEYMLYARNRTLLESLTEAFVDILDESADRACNMVLTNGIVSYIFIRDRPFYNLLCNECHKITLSTVPLKGFVVNKRYVRDPRARALILMFIDEYLAAYKYIVRDEIVIDRRRKATLERRELLNVA